MIPVLHTFSVTKASLAGICTTRGTKLSGRGVDCQQQRDGHISVDVRCSSSKSSGHGKHNDSRRFCRKFPVRVAAVDVVITGSLSRGSSHRGDLYRGRSEGAELEGTSIGRGDYERCGCGARSQIFSQRKIRRSSIPSKYATNLPNVRERRESLVERGKRRKLAHLDHKLQSEEEEREQDRHPSSNEVKRRRDYGKGLFKRLQSSLGWVERMEEDFKWKVISSAAAAGLSLALCLPSAAAAAEGLISRASNGEPMAQVPTMIGPATENVQPHMEAQLRHEFLAQIEVPRDRVEEIGQPQNFRTTDGFKLEMLGSDMVPIFKPYPAVMSPVATTVVGDVRHCEYFEDGETRAPAPSSSSQGQSAGVRAREEPEIYPLAAVQAGSTAVAAAATAGSRTVGQAASVAAVQITTATTAAVKPGVSLLTRIISHFGGGGVAGAMGATLVYPLDTIKTRMQAQSSTKDGEEEEYKDELDCFLQLVAKEGPSSLYSGLVPQLVGIAPEKAMKLTVNEVLMDMLEKEMPGVGPWALELIAGGGGGFSQVVFTNPMEIVKVRLQTQSKNTVQKNSWDVVKELGVKGLYNGAGVTMARDIPSSAIFFAAYTFIRQFYPNQSFMAGFVAAIPATVLVTPFDVVKTRLQMETATGEEAYENAYACFASILKKEGTGALFKGSLARVLKTSPQFGLTLMLYNILSTGSPLDTLGSFLMQQGTFVLNMENKILNTFFP